MMRVETAEFPFNIPAGFEKAFYGLGKKNPQQFLLMPQSMGTDGAVPSKCLESIAQLSQGWA